MCGLWTWMTSVDTSAQLELILSSATSGCRWVNNVALCYLLDYLINRHPRDLKTINIDPVASCQKRLVQPLFKEFLSPCLTLQASHQNPPPLQPPPPPGIPLQISAAAAPMACMRTQLIRPPTSSASRESPTCTAASLVSSTGTPASAATGPEPQTELHTHQGHECTRQ